MLIRDFTFEDQTKIKELALKCWLFTYKNIYSESEIRTMVDDWYSEDVHKEILKLVEKGGAIAKVVEDHGELIGLVTLEMEGLPELKRLYVDPDHLRQGIGLRLLTLIEDRLKEKSADGYFCLVHRKNKIGQNFYRKNGFLLDESKSDNKDHYMFKPLSVSNNI